MRDHREIVVFAEDLGGEDRAVGIDHRANPGIRPGGVAHHGFVTVGLLPQDHERPGGSRIGAVAGGRGDVLAIVEHLEVPDGDGGAGFRAEVAHVFAMHGEGAAIPAEVFAMLLGKAVQCRVPLDIGRAVAAAPRVHFLEQLSRERGITCGHCGSFEDPGRLGGT